MIFFIWGFVAAVVYVALLAETELRTRMRVRWDVHFDGREKDFDRAFKAAIWPVTVWFYIPRFLWTVHQYRGKMAENNKESDYD